ncbi:MAG: hypothetical protein HXP18_01655 [Veillonella sp.]|nr:hypothetical protein [Veillonella sp.]
MYGELRTALNNVASQFDRLALQLEESGHTKACAVINNVKKLHDIDDYCAAHYFARNTDQLIKALAFNTSDYDDDFVNAVVIGATGYACGYYPTIMAPENGIERRYLAEDVVIRSKLGKHIPLKEIESAYSDLRSICGWIADEYPDDARERMEKAVSVLDAADVFYDLCRDYAIVDVGDIGGKYYDVLALAFEAVAWRATEAGSARFWESLARHMQLMPEQRARDYAIAPTKKNLWKETLLLQFVQRQISLNNLNCAAACAIQWRDELRELAPYVSEKTRIWICEA